MSVGSTSSKSETAMQEVCEVVRGLVGDDYGVAINWPNKVMGNTILVQPRDNGDILQHGESFGSFQLHLRLLPLFVGIDPQTSALRALKLFEDLAPEMVNLQLSTMGQCPHVLGMDPFTTVLVGDKSEFITSPIRLSAIEMRF